MGKQFVNKTDFENFKRRQSQRFKTENIEDWIAPALLNSWVNYNTATHQPAGYYRDPLGIVRMRGAMKNGTITSGTVLFTLPAGYRPSKYIYGYGYSYDGAASSWAWFYIGSNGNVVIGGAASNVLVAIDGICFRAEQ